MSNRVNVITTISVFVTVFVILSRHTCWGRSTTCHHSTSSTSFTSCLPTPTTALKQNLRCVCVGYHHRSTCSSIGHREFYYNKKRKKRIPLIALALSNNENDSISESSISSWPKVIKTYDCTTNNKNWPYTVEDMKRQDESNDVNFYDKPKFQRHLDEWALFSLREYYGTEIYSSSNILDLCSSWMSHLPPPDDDRERYHVTGIGMNVEELKANPLLQNYYVQDLNDNPFLSDIENESMDIVLMTCSIDYLIQPQQIIQEIHRLLKSDGKALIAFSNRYFAKKVVQVWLDAADTNEDKKDDDPEQKRRVKRNVNGEFVNQKEKQALDRIASLRRMDIVANYFSYSKEWKSIEGLDVRLQPMLENITKFIQQGGIDAIWRWLLLCIFRGSFFAGDPIYVVKAIKK